MSKTLYNHNEIEKKWQEVWAGDSLFQDSAKGDISNKLYLLFAFAYPSGSGLHVGHVESKTALDILARYNRMNGKDVFFPVGWDAFGLPAENYAIKTGTPPEETTKKAMATFGRQLRRIGISYDWENEIATCQPTYYKWTQWIFLQLFNKGLAYQSTGKVNWCPDCQTVLANEQVVNGLCERCDYEVVQKDMKQWYFGITKYQDELIDGLKDVDWPEPTKQQQIQWIGKKNGINIEYEIQDSKDLNTKNIICFTTRPDTNFGATFIVLAPEHEFSLEIAKGNDQVKQYIEEASKKTELERQQDGNKKSGAFTGHYATNQLTGKKMPIWVSDFVLGGFGTGAVVGVPAHDKRDFEFTQFVNENFSKESHIKVIRVVVGKDGDESQITKVSQVQEEDGVMINSDFLDGVDIHQATEKIMDYMEEKDYGKKVTTYRLRDWLISRQRYWGTPIPIVYDPEGKPHAVKEEHLPWMLPTDVDFKPTGESPLRSSVEFKKRVEDLYGKGWTPEYDTMDTFVDSSWYFLRYTDTKNEQMFASKEQLAKWCPVDFYMIGAEHTVLHLLYSRFFTKFLRDEGYLNYGEPFSKMRHQGMILGPDGKKMSKSKGNVINPDDIVDKFGADTLRVYEMFMGPIYADKPWDDRSVVGIHRFLRRVYDLVMRDDNEEPQDEVISKLHKTIKKVSNDIPELKFNTAISAMMELINLWESNKGGLSREDKMKFVQLLTPLAPFITEEMWHKVNNKTVHLSTWPTYDEELIKEDEIILPVQVNGKLRGELILSREALEGMSKEEIISQAKSLEKVTKWLEGVTIRKEIYVPGKIISLVV